jgi:hypothetical protein
MNSLTDSQSLRETATNLERFWSKLNPKLPMDDVAAKEAAQLRKIADRLEARGQ